MLLASGVALCWVFRMMALGGGWTALGDQMLGANVVLAVLCKWLLRCGLVDRRHLQESGPGRTFGASNRRPIVPTPSVQTPELIETVLERLSLGDTLAAICKDVGVTRQTWCKWVRQDEELRLAHASARDLGADAIAEEVLAIVDAEPERVTTYDERGNPNATRIDAGHVQWIKNRAELRLKLLAKWSPAKYGDKMALTGADGESPVQIETSDSSIRQLVSELRTAGLKQAHAVKSEPRKIEARDAIIEQPAFDPAPANAGDGRDLL